MGVVVARLVADGCVARFAVPVDGVVVGRFVAAGCCVALFAAPVDGVVLGRFVALLFRELLMLLVLELSTLMSMLLFTFRVGALMFVGARYPP